MNSVLLDIFCLDQKSDIVADRMELSLVRISAWIKALHSGGRLFLGIDNRNSLRYDCGDEPEGVAYTNEEVSTLLNQAGIPYKCYSVYPCLEYPQFVYASDCLPNEELMIRYFPKYNHPEKVFAIEEFQIDGLIPQGLFHKKANAFLFECALDDTFSDIRHITFSADRYKYKALATIIHDNGNVEKRALYPEGISQLHQLDENTQNLKKHGIPVVEGRLINNRYIMPYISSMLATTYLKETLRKSREEFIALYDKFVEQILQSSEHIKVNDDGIILAKGYLDMVPLNAFFDDGTFLFFDQEFYLESCPAKAIIYRALIIPYCGDEEVWRLCPLQILLERYGLADRQEYWQHYADDFLESLRDPVEWAKLRKEHGRSDMVTEGNRRIRQMKQEPNPFSEIGGKEVFVFGTGHFADKFVDMYHNDYHIVAAVDNNSNKQGDVWKNLPVYSPDVLRTHKNVFVMICIKDYEPVIQQLNAMGVEHKDVYDAHRIYPGRQAENIPYTGKPYHIGYCAGVYDLFHIGHVNIFRKAKELCDYLIVGVVTDIGVRNNKHTEPFVPYEERLEMVRSCRYVDEAVEIPYIYCRTPDMFEKYHFDVQFSGSDYEHDPDWLAMKQYLNERGAEMVFFPYTECTSSTKIKNLITKGLLEKI